jgi:hypothetical protein
VTSFQVHNPNQQQAKESFVPPLIKMRSLPHPTLKYAGLVTRLTLFKGEIEVPVRKGV